MMGIIYEYAKKLVLCKNDVTLLIAILKKIIISSLKILGGN